MNLLVTGAFDWTKDELDTLRVMGHQVLLLQQETDDLPCDDLWVEGIIGNGFFLSHPIEQLHNLKYIQLTSAGYDRVPLNYIKEHGIPIYNARGVYSIPMAELAVNGILEIYKQTRFFFEKQKNRQWEKHRGLIELCGKTVCIVGCGSVGTECAKRLAAFDARIIGADLYPSSIASDYYESVKTLEYLDELLAESDIVILTLPLTEESRHMMDSEKLGHMKNGAVLVNIARGGIIDTVALEKALNANLRGAVLDVFEEEPLNSESPLWDTNNVIITPHNSFVGDGNHERMWRLILSNLGGQNSI